MFTWFDKIQPIFSEVEIKLLAAKDYWQKKLKQKTAKLNKSLEDYLHYMEEFKKRDRYGDADQVIAELNQISTDIQNFKSIVIIKFSFDIQIIFERAETINIYFS
jgi:hypothetical protein